MADYHERMAFANDLKVCRVLLSELDDKLRFGNLQRDEARAIVLATMSTCREVLDS